LCWTLHVCVLGETATSPSVEVEEPFHLTLLYLVCFSNFVIVPAACFY